MRELILGALIAAGVAASAAAHDFWMQPTRFWSQPGAAVPVTLWAGHGKDRERWGVDTRRILTFSSVGPAGVADRRSSLLPGPADRDQPVSLAQTGTHVLFMQSSHAQSDLPALRFEAYLVEEGLTPAQTLRARRGHTTRPGREIYSRRAKALVQVGPASRQAQPHVTRPVGLTLEIVPELNPYAAGAGARLPVRVFFEGKPLAGALIDLTDLDADAKPVEAHRTDAAGRAVFKGRTAGLWQLNVVWTKPIIGEPRGDFDTTFSSLTFGFPR